MPTLAELQINVNSKPIEDSTKALNEFAVAAEKANKAKSGFNSSGTSSGGQPTSIVPQGESKKVEDLSSAIDRQVKKFKELELQRKKLTSSDLNVTNPAEFERLNKIIDANIAKVQQQGNAITQLATKQNQDAEKKKSAVEAELKAQERLVKAQEAQENVLTNAAARQKRELDSTIAGLDAQVKIQEKYNKTVETLNKQRALSGMSGPNSNSLSGAEYDTYIARAGQQRDAALAPKDNTSQLNSVQSKLDSYTATLGKAERAEVQYARAVKTLNEAQALGLVTTEQYDSKLASFAAHRDSAVKAANDNAFAEQAFERQLRSVVTAYDPVQRAQDSYNSSVKILAEGLQSGKISAEAFNKALTEQRVALDSVKNAQTVSSGLADDYNEALRAVLPYRKELENLEQRQRALDSAKAAGKITTPQQIKDYDDATAAIKRQTLEYQKRIEAGSNAGITFKQEQAALRGLPAQFTDIVVSLQGGQAPLTVLLQQGGQIKDMFGGILPAIQALGGALAAMITPLSVLGTAVAGVAIAAYQGSEEIVAFNKAMILSAGAAGVSASQFSAYRTQLDAIVGTAGQAAEAFTQMEQSGKINGDLFVQVGEAAITMQRATGTAMASIIDDFASLAKDPVQAAITLDDKYKFLTSSVLAQADALVRQGKEQEAVKLLQAEMADATTIAGQKIIEEAGYMERAWLGVKDAVLGTWDAVKGIGRDNTSQDELNILEDELKKIENAYGGDKNLAAKNGQYALVQKEIEQKKQRIKVEQYMAQLDAEAEARRKASNKAIAEQSSAYEANVAAISRVEGARLALAKAEKQEVDIKAAQADKGEAVTEYQLKLINASKAAAQKRLDDAIEAENKKKNPTGPADTRQVQEVKSNLAVITSEYDGYYKKITALREANVISDEAAYYAQKAILDAQARATDESYAKQIDAIQALQGNKKNSVSTNISLDNQLTKAEAARLKAQQDFATKQDQIAAKENGRVKEQTARINEYRKALEQQVESLRKQGERAVSGLGQGTRRRGLNDSLNSIDDKFDTESLNLASQYGDGSRGMSFEEYSSKLEDLKKNHDALRETAVKNYEDMGEAQKDFTLGASAAWEDYFDNASNFAGKMQDAFSGVFSDLTDSLYDFVTTGKLSFSDLAANFAKAVLRMGVEWAAAQTLRMLGITAEKTLVIGAEAAKASAKVAGNTLAATSSVASNTKIVASEVTSAGTTFSSWLPAALVKSVGTGGAAAIIGGAALVAAFALSKGLKKGFSNGGYTGDGGVNDPAGIVHKGEVVWSQKDIQRAGGVAAVESLRKGGTSPSISGSGGMSKGGDVNIPINVQVQGQPGMSDAEALKQAKVTADTVRGMMLQVIQQQKRPGGLLA